VRLLVKKLGRHMPEDVVREELENLGMCPGSIAAPLGQPRPGERQSPPLKPHFVSVGRGSEVAKVRSLTELCGFRGSVEIYIAPKGPRQCKG
jgi:hypothetical protein